MKTAAYDQLRAMIIYAELKPGEQIHETSLMTQLQLGRTPLREAMIQLRQQGLLVVVPQNGTYVAKIDLSAAEDARFVREELEKAVVKDAIERAGEQLTAVLTGLLAQATAMATMRDPRAFFQFDNAFHQAIFQAAGKDAVWQWLQSVNAQLDRFRWLRLGVTALDWATILAQHQQIVAAVAAGDVQAGQRLIGEHLRLMLAEEDSLLKAFPEYFVAPPAAD